jgi:hypothetical protein
MAASFGLEVIENPSTVPCDKLVTPDPRSCG